MFGRHCRPQSVSTVKSAARRLWAGSASAGTAFIHSWRGRSRAATAARDVIRGVAAVLPELWSSAGVEAATTRLLRHADAIAGVANRAASLAEQADNHARGYAGAVAQMPKPVEFEEVRTELLQAVEANARFPGRYTPLVSSLIARQGALQHQALNTQAQYHEQTERATSPEQAGQFSAQLPAMVPGFVGAVGGLIGGAVAAAVQVPQALMQTGQQLAQAATQGLSGLATSAANGIDPAATEFDAEHPAASSNIPGASEIGATTAAGATDMSPVSPSTSSAPPPATSVPQGVSAASVHPTTGPSAIPMGMPMGMVAPPQLGDVRQASGRRQEDRRSSGAAQRIGHRQGDPGPPCGGGLMTGFDDLDDAAKVRYSQSELATTFSELTAVLDRLAALRTNAEDPDGDVRLTLGPDGRLMSLFIDESVPGRLTHLALEEKINNLLAEANRAAEKSRKESY